MPVRIEIDPSAGVCFGVEKAIETAEHHLDSGEQIYSLGSMLHNPDEIRRLSEKGLKTISETDLQTLTGSKVLIRAHGAPPDTYHKAGKAGIEIIDATCPIVRKLQKRIQLQYQELDKNKEQIIIFGKPNHPETEGLMGQTNHEAILVSDPDDISHVPLKKQSYLYAQTTMDPQAFDVLVRRLKDRMEVLSDNNLKANCTICNQMKRRKPDLAEFAGNYDLLLFVSGKDSSNGSVLYTYVSSLHPNAFWIESPDDIQSDWLIGANTIGISGATSTPVWQLEQIKKYLESLTAG